MTLGESSPFASFSLLEGLCGSPTFVVVGSYNCAVVNGQKGCCLNGKTCTSGGGGNNECVNTGYLPCAGEDFCCRTYPYPRFLIWRSVHSHSHVFSLFVIAAGYTCYRDSANNPKCSLYSTNTDTTTFFPPTLTYSTPHPTSSSNGNTNNDNSPTPTPSEALGNLNGAMYLKDPLDFFGIAPFFAWIGM